ncbi:MAG: site-2 protease family protein, partial [Planctomycetota bacterium]
MTPPIPEPSADAALEVVLERVPEIESVTRNNDGGFTVCLGKDRFFRMGPLEYHIFSSVDGQRTIGEIVARVEESNPGFDNSQTVQFLGELIRQGLLNELDESGQPGGESPMTGAPDQSQASWLQSATKAGSFVISQRIPLIPFNRIAGALNPWIGFVFSKLGVWFTVISAIVAIVLVRGRHDDWMQQLQQIFSEGSWVGLALLWFITKGLHEVGHAVCARRHGVEVGKGGVMLFFMAPLAYVDITRAWQLNSRFHRIHIALAGIQVEVMLASLAAIMWCFLEPSSLRYLLFQITLLCGPATLMVNLNPLLRLDGYYALSDLCQIPNLRMHGRSQLKSLLIKGLLAVPSDSPRLAGWRYHFANAHALASVVFQVVWMGGLLIGISAWNPLLAVPMSLIALTLWVLVPVAIFCVGIWKREALPSSDDSPWFYIENRLGLTIHRRRLIGAVGLAVVMTLAIVQMPNPFARRALVLVRHRDAPWIHTPSDGFIRKIHVRDGQRVDQGALLIEMEHPEIQRDLANKIDQLTSISVQADELRSEGSLRDALAQDELAESLERQIADLREQIEAMKITANRSGIVLIDRPTKWLGTFQNRGQRIARVVDPQDKELVVSMRADLVDTFRAAIERSDCFKVKLRDGRKFVATPVELTPKASLQLNQEEFGIHRGGPLPVQQNVEQEGFETMNPRAAGVASIHPTISHRLRSGQIGW